MQSTRKVKAMTGIWGDRINRLFFVDGNLYTDEFFIMLQQSLLYEDGNFSVNFQQDGPPSHSGNHLRRWLN